MLLDKEFNSHFKSGYFAYGLLRVLSFITSIQNNLLGNSTHVHQVFKLQKRVVRVLSGVGSRSSCRSLFRKLNILPIACQYILSLMLLIVDNQKDFLTNAYVHGTDTRNKNHLYLRVASLSCVQKGVSLSGIKIFNSLPSNIQSYRNDTKSLKNKLYRYLIIIHSFYSITEFLECKLDKDNTKLLL